MANMRAMVLEEVKLIIRWEQGDVNEFIEGYMGTTISRRCSPCPWQVFAGWRCASPTPKFESQIQALTNCLPFALECCLVQDRVGPLQNDSTLATRPSTVNTFV